MFHDLLIFQRELHLNCITIEGKHESASFFIFNKKKLFIYVLFLVRDVFRQQRIYNKKMNTFFVAIEMIGIIFKLVEL